MDTPNELATPDLSTPPGTDNTEEAPVKTDDTPPESSQENTEEETSVDERLVKLGLDKRYATLDDALYGLKNQDGALTRTQQENADLRRIIQQFATREPQKPAITEQPFNRDDFITGLDTDPLGTLDKAGYARKQDVEDTKTRLARFERSTSIQNFANQMERLDPDLEPIASHFRQHANEDDMPPPPPGVSRVWDALAEYYATRPRLAAVWADVLPDVYAIVHPKGEVDPKPEPTTTVQPLSKARKEKATTTPGAGGGGKGGAFNWGKASTKDMEAELKRQGLWDDSR